MNKIEHKEIQIANRIHKNKGYSDENYYLVSNSTVDRDTFISTVRAQAGNKNTKINILYEGKTSEIPVELLEKYLCVSDTSYNPSRPFRWYRGNYCADTNDSNDIKRCRDLSFNEFLVKIDNPEYIFVYEIE